ncbi:MrcB family domain-containing protein [Streptomyces xiamenensis]
MGIRDLLIEVARTYDASGKAEKGKPGHELLWAAGDRLRGLLPYGMVAEGHGGEGTAASTPWIEVRNEGEIKTGMDGLYLAYIYATDLRTVTLTLQQGVTAISKGMGTRGRRLYTYIGKRTQKFHELLPESLLEGLKDQPDFLPGKGTWRPEAYAHASIGARVYLIDELPNEADLCADLAAMRILLLAARKTAHLIVEDFSADGPKMEVPPGYRHSTTTEPSFDGLDGFRPKSAEAYIAHLEAQQQVRRRDHEQLISDFGPYVDGLGFTPITQGVHPRDVILRKDGQEWLVEAKVVRDGNVTVASREALSQLFEYRYFHYEQQRRREPHLLALFSEDVVAHQPYLERHGIASVWQTPDGWRGSDRAAAWGIAARG